MEAIELADRLHDYELSYKACSQLGTIYLYQDMIAEAEPLLHSALSAAQHTGNSTYCSYANSYLGRLFGLKHQFSTAVDYYQTAILIATPYSSAWELAMRELVTVYFLAQSPHRALSFLDSCALSIRSSQVTDNTKVYLAFGALYLNMGRLQDTANYLNMAVSSDNIYTRSSAYNNLYSLCKRTGEYSNAIHYNELYWGCVDSISKIDSRKEIQAIQMRYNTMKLTAEKQAIANKVVNRNLLLVCIITVCSFVAFGLSYVTLLKQRKILRIQAELSNLQKALLSNERVISHNQVEISSLKQSINDKVADFEILKGASESQLVAKQSEIDILQNKVVKLSSQNTLLDSINGKLKKRIQDQTITIQQRNKSIDEYAVQLERRESCPNILLRVKQTQQINENEWGEFYAAVDALHKNFTERLVKKHTNLTSKDVRLCVLIRLGYDTPLILVILHLEEDSLYKSRSRLK